MRFLLHLPPLLAGALLVSSAHALPPAQHHQPRSDRACPVERPAAQRATVRTHRVARGESLGSVAARYGTSVRVVAAANGLDSETAIKTGQRLVVPLHLRPGGGDDWLRYARSSKQPGALHLYTYTSRFQGRVLADGRVLPDARRAISALLGAKGERPPIADRLLRLLVRVSDTFGGRPVRVVSGFRKSSFYSDSRHPRSEAVDFSIPGVPNAALRQYLLLLEDVGVGYYPNSSFVHLDVRSCPIQWTDYAGPGEAPRRTLRKPHVAKAPSKPPPKSKASPARAARR